MLEQQQHEESPKRRSTFYVALDGGSTNKFTKSVSCDSSTYVCNTFPIKTSKTSPNVPTMLSRTQSTNNDSGYSSSSSSSKKKIPIPEPTMLQQKGKVQSLTRIFEAPKNNKSNNNNNKTNNSVETTDQRKKVERTRSFKTIERFQNRFVGKKDQQQIGRVKDPVRLNKTTGSIETEIGKFAKEEPEICRRKVKNDEAKVNVGSSSQVRTVNNGAVKTKNLREQAKQVAEQRSGKSSQANNSSNSNGSSLANLLIRRTHSTKLTRSTSTLVKNNKHASIDACNEICKGGCNDVKSDETKNLVVDSENDELLRLLINNDETICNVGAYDREEIDTDPGVHSGLLMMIIFFFLQFQCVRFFPNLS